VDENENARTESSSSFGEVYTDSITLNNPNRSLILEKKAVP